MLIRILINLVLAAALMLGAVRILLAGSLVLPSESSSGDIHFVGASLWFLALTLVSLSGFALLVARGWWRGDFDVPGPGPLPLMRDPVAKGEIIARYWVLPVVALASLVAAFATSR
jgi:hypothetical protein